MSHPAVSLPALEWLLQPGHRIEIQGQAKRRAAESLPKHAGLQHRHVTVAARDTKIIDTFRIPLLQ